MGSGLETVARFLRHRGWSEEDAALLAIAIVAAWCVDESYARDVLAVVLTPAS